MSYRVLARSAPAIFFVLGAFARLSYAITPIGSLLLFQHATGSHSFAGLAAGLQSVAIAVAGFAAGGLATRWGARRLGTTLAVLNAFAAVFLVAVSLSGSRQAMLVGAVLVGLSQPHVGLLVRVHWSHVLGRGTPLLRTAFAYESAVDELSFVIGPAVAGLFAAGLPGVGPLLGMALLLLGTSVPFAAMYVDGVSTRPDSTGGVPVRRMALLVASMAALGGVFGSIQAATTAHASGDAGFLYACLGIGGALSGVAYGWLPRTFHTDTRYLVFSSTLVLGMAVLPVSPWPAVGILVAGFAIAPYMITLYALTDALAPPARLPVAMAALGAGGPVGTALGQSVTGALIDGPGLASAWLAPLGCAGVALTIAVVSRGSTRTCPR
jgi:hypothetical protein